MSYLSLIVFGLIGYLFLSMAIYFIMSRIFHGSSGWISVKNHKTRIVKYGNEHIYVYKIQLRVLAPLFPVIWLWEDYQVLPRNMIKRHLKSIANGGRCGYGYRLKTFKTRGLAEEYIENAKSI